MATGEKVMIVSEAERLENQRWAASRRPLSDAERREAIDILLHRGGDAPPEPGDEIPAEYLAWEKRRDEAVETAALSTKARSRT